MLEVENNLEELNLFKNWQLLLSLGIIPAIVLAVIADILESNSSFALICFPQPCKKTELFSI